MTLSTCLCYSPDEQLYRQIAGTLHALAHVRHIQTPEDLAAIVRGTTPHLILLDSRTPQSADIWRTLLEHRPDMPLIVMGAPRCRPLLQAERDGVFGTLDLPLNDHLLRESVRHGLLLLAAIEQGRPLPQPDDNTPPASDTPRDSKPSMPARTLRQIRDEDSLLRHALDWVAGTASALRAGIFIQDRDDKCYHLRHALQGVALDDNTAYPADHPLSVGLWEQAQLISAARLRASRRTPAQSEMLRAMEEMGAEIILPLLGAKALTGWVFIGPRSTGYPYRPEDMTMLLHLSEQISILLDNSSLYRQSQSQKVLLETLLDTIPTGILMVETSFRIRWLNKAARQILGLTHQVEGEEIATLGSPIADGIYRTINQPDEPGAEWTIKEKDKSLALSARTLHDHEACQGAVVFVRDLSREQTLREQEEHIERKAFWSELAASMSHEVRNPLVAIKTFASLLPERYDDPAFREEFRTQVNKEIGRLEAIIDQINAFAYPPPLQFGPCKLADVLQEAVTSARSILVRDELPLEWDTPSDDLVLRGDSRALSECFAHLISNAVEATVTQPHPHIRLTVRPDKDSSQLVVTITDNGAGIPAAIQDNIFSPFCTSKARGMGLGLPIAKRTIIDHNGRIEVNSNRRGSRVCVTLPLADGKGKA